MDLQWIDWLVIAGYFAFTVGVGVAMRKRASSNVDEYFLSGRSLPWWIAGTSMVATSFASDTPLVVSGWVRDYGIWKNWLWWCYAVSGMLGVFLFARWWRRSGVMTKAELTELRYGSADARILRGFLGVLHALVLNVMVLNWVLLAAKKILGGVFGIPDVPAVILACAIAMVYSLLAGFWGVVLTDLAQFTISIIGAIALAVICWQHVGGIGAVEQAIDASDSFSPDVLAFMPAAGATSIWDPGFWTVSVAALAVYLGVSWWAAESADGSSTAIQRVAASKDERQGMLAVLWYNLAHYALRPWPWVIVGLASIVVLPNIDVHSPVAGKVYRVDTEDARVIEIIPTGGDVNVVAVDLTTDQGSDDWWAKHAKVEVDETVEADQLIARSDGERAYVVMLKRYLPVGLLGLVLASLLAAFMSTIDTHVNLASSFFVNDVYRRFARPGRSERHYVVVARIASVCVLILGGLLAWQSKHIGGLFEFFLAFLGGVGPIYVLRWFWWRITARAEIAALVTSGLVTTLLTALDVEWRLGPFSQDGNLEAVGRILIVVASSIAVSLSTLLLWKPNPSDLVPFYTRVRPLGAWGPVRALCPSIEPNDSLRVLLIGIVGGLSLIFGSLFGTGCWILGREGAITGGAIAAIGAAMTVWSVRRMTTLPPTPPAESQP